MSNRDGKGSKPNKKQKIRRANKKCPFCKATLEKCGQFGDGHSHHRSCPKCKWSNY